MNTIALVIVASIWGAMAFFAAVYAPLVFIKLEPAVAGRFIREVFPVYYLAMGATSALALLAMLASAGTRHADIIALALVCAGFWLARYVLMPRINDARDAGETGKQRFKRLHALSVIINTVQLLIVLAVLARFVWR